MNDRKVMMDFSLFQNVLHIIQQVAQPASQPVIYLSGGEPLLHHDFLRILNYGVQKIGRISILTNGILIPDFIEHLIPHRNHLNVQVSLDGDQATHDAIRSQGSYQRAVDALYILQQHKIIHWISYTVSQQNKHCYDSILRMAQKTDSFSNNVTPYVGDPAQMLDYFEWKEFKYRYEKSSRQMNFAESHSPRSCGWTYQCGSFFGGVTVNPDGTLAGCARINNLKGNYTEMNRYFLSHPPAMNQMCMQQKWGEISNLELLSRLE